MNAKVWVLGDAVVDLLPESEGRLLQCPGGAPANVAVGVARLGGSSGFIGRVGDDPFGRFMRHTLQQEHVDISHMRLDHQRRTSTVVVDLDDQGERTFTFMVRPSADLFLVEEDLPEFAANQWLHVCSIALSAEPSRSTTFAAMEKIKRAGGRVSFDPNIRPDLWQDQELLHACLDRALNLANVVKLSEEELVFISGSDDLDRGIASVTERYQPELLLVTQGKAGVLAAFQQQFTHFSARPVVSVDTTGAGDAFVAGLLASLAANGMPTDISALEPTIALAQTCGALATTAKGAMTALPWQHDLNRQF
ncbi:TPA: aminoimidazole riboside kinase [Klebsiella pneumoniae subsp. pneumoniae]|uniref:aminoimidazole riboside kinase n=1 Tax=Enterobacteriaceae TaxID=543 RepID=UPI001BDFC33D|nr:MULTISPECIES: aminoimidazole riboside kinase [Enterobacteriaceae]MBT1918006.1 aminoimidazole riboside kinase [Enterobacter hormaechei subsp. xiangfangensis]MCM7856377.1 aminoimidazole riboside kinase [Enterobacter hormaechei]HBW1604162.1 aminoimidazole riboside kinase [Klebsiella pneumoniae]HDT3777138.1 aminoimidazole riboside kinase [Klebsiella pneumoniae subsp. pneumoniae]MBT1886675.1 aminoimidazole riboside kinase [Enterobacter mori]